MGNNYDGSELAYDVDIDVDVDVEAADAEVDELSQAIYDSMPEDLQPLAALLALELGVTPQEAAVFMLLFG